MKSDENIADLFTNSITSIKRFALLMGVMRMTNNNTEQETR